tara:strand:- start:231 stop:449 length:219 start_codon:yes stop_codon:yes gene_type:complete
MNKNNSTIIQPGDLVTLKGMSKLREKPIGMVKKKWATDHIEIFWLNERMANRFALTKVNDSKKLEIISKANQ